MYERMAEPSGSSPKTKVLVKLLIFICAVAVALKVVLANGCEEDINGEKKLKSGAPSLVASDEVFENNCEQYANSCESCLSNGCFFQETGTDSFCGKECLIMDISCYGKTALWEAKCPSKVKTLEPKAKKIPGNCQQWFDGCNECRRGKVDGPAMCTLKFCPEPEVPVCRTWFKQDPPSDCKVWFDGCNMCRRTSPKSIFACTEKYCPELNKEPHCMEKIEKESIDNVKWCPESRPQYCRMFCNPPKCGENECVNRDNTCCKFSCKQL